MDGDEIEEMKKKSKKSFQTLKCCLFIISILDSMAYNSMGNEILLVFERVYTFFGQSRLEFFSLRRLLYGHDDLRSS